MNKLDRDLLELLGGPVHAAKDDGYQEVGGHATVVLTFENGTKLRATFWRLLKGDKAHISSFDHMQKYGLPAQIDAKQVLLDLLEGTTCTDARLDRQTGDLQFSFSGELLLQIFKFTGYEIWEIRFPDGSVEYSNYAFYGQ